MQNAESLVVISNNIQLWHTLAGSEGWYLPPAQEVRTLLFRFMQVVGYPVVLLGPPWRVEVKLVAMLAGIYLLVSNMAGKSSTNTVWMAKSEDFLSEFPMFPLPCLKKPGISPMIAVNPTLCCTRLGSILAAPPPQSALLAAACWMLPNSYYPSVRSLHVT